MKTTAMFVEQILIGGLVFVIVALLFPEWAANFKPSGPLSSVLFGTTALGAAYVAGIVCDRFSDTLLEDQEQRDRLKYALLRVERYGVREKDLFPVGRFNHQVLSAGEGVTDHVNYLRSRIRIGRALTCLLPAMTISLSVFINFRYCLDIAHFRTFGISNIVVVYLGVFLLKIKNPFKPPRTFPSGNESYSVHVETIKKYLAHPWTLWDPLSWGFVVIFVASMILEGLRGASYFMLLPAVGLTLTLICGWSVFRINKTHMALLDQHNEYILRSGLVGQQRL